MTLKTVKVEIVPYKASWAGEFAAIARPLRQGLKDLALRIDHIGSTAVAGLEAKDRIDVQVTVESPNQFGPVKSALQVLGYVEAPDIRFDHVPPCGPFDESEWEKRYFRPPADQRPTNLHVRVEGKANQRYALLFRDYLRRHSSMAAAYAEVKRKIAFYHEDDIEAYCEIKDPVCDIIISGAYDWAQRAAWLPGLSDA